MSRVKDIDILIKKYEERLQGIQKLAEIEDEAHYGTALLESPENTGYELSLCLDALRDYRTHLMEDQKAVEDKRSELRALCYSSRANDVLRQSAIGNGLGSAGDVSGQRPVASASDGAS